MIEGKPADAQCQERGERKDWASSRHRGRGLTDQAQRQRLAKSSVLLGKGSTASLCSLERVVRPLARGEAKGHHPSVTTNCADLLGVPSAA